MSVGRGNDRTELPKRGKTSKPAQSTAGTGYGRPPEHSRFQQGKSGNPNGRPKKSRNAKTIIRRVLDSTVTVREGARTRTVSKLEGIILRRSGPSSTRCLKSTLRGGSENDVIPESSSVRGSARSF
jgi:Family of unknown function (DUF5681)